MHVAIKKTGAGITRLGFSSIICGKRIARKTGRPYLLAGMATT